MLIASHQLHYIPWLPYLAKMKLADRFLATDDVQYRKGHFINRNRIAGPQFPDGQRWLTIPVRYPRFPDRPPHSAAINEMEIIDGWQFRHADILSYEYRKAPFRAELDEYIYEMLLYAPDMTLLYEPLLAGLQWLRPDVRPASAFLMNRTFADKNERLIEMVLNAGGDGYLMGLGAQNEYIDRAEFSAAGIKLYRLRMKEFTYPQVSVESFLAGLGFIDALANIGLEEMWRLVQSNFTIEAVTD